MEVILLSISIIIVWLIIAVATAAIAEKKKRNTDAWLLAGLLYGPIALIVAMIMQSMDDDETEAGEKKGKGTEPQRNVKQDGLGQNLMESESFGICPTCGQSVDQGETTCPMCRETIKTGALKCKHCGEVFSEPAGVTQ